MMAQLRVLTRSTGWKTVQGRPYSSQSSVNISGIFPAIATPFSRDNSIAYDKLSSNFDTWNKKDFAGYVVLGSNGEAVSLRTQEKLDLLKQARKLAKPSQLVIAGSGCHSTAETIELNKEIARNGSAQAALVITPSFYRGKMNDKALQSHYEAVADGSPLPIILYSVPGNTNLDLSADVIIRLSQHNNIIGLKDSGGDVCGAMPAVQDVNVFILTASLAKYKAGLDNPFAIGKMTRIIHATKDQNFQILVGSAGILLPALLMGCVGAISGLANILGDEVCKLQRLYLEKDLTSAVPLQQRLVYPNMLVTQKFGVSGLKAAMDLVGLYGGVPRPPLLPAEASEVELIVRGFKQEGFLQ